MWTADYISSYKERKFDMLTFLGRRFWNYPHGISGVELSGSLNYTIDGRDFTDPGLFAQKYEFSITMPVSLYWTRISPAKAPWENTSLPVSPAQGEFILAHNPLTPWSALLLRGTTPTAVKVGDRTYTEYSRADEADPWDEDSSVTTDINANYIPDIYAGGEPLIAAFKGGGRGDGSPDEKVRIDLNVNWSGTSSGLLPDFDAIAEILRLPWVTPWSAETDFFDDHFSDHLTTKNTADGGGHSGTCSLSLALP